MRLPGHREVDRALAGTIREIDNAITALNRQAAALVTKGSYERTEEMVAAGRSLSEFRGRVVAVRDEWRTLRQSRRSASEETTPLWQYYRPILETLVAMGGEAPREALEESTFELLKDRLKPADLSPMARGIPRWKAMIRRSRRALTDEGFIQNGSGPWRITSGGKRAAENPDQEISS